MNVNSRKWKYASLTRAWLVSSIRASSNFEPLDQHVHPHSMISVIVVRCLDSIIPLLTIAGISRPMLVSVGEQAGLRFN